MLNEWIYVLRAVGRERLYKIGYSTAGPTRRAQTVAATAPFAVEVVWSQEGCGRAEERRLHEAFRARRVRLNGVSGGTEWFQLCESDARLLEDKVAMVRLARTKSHGMIRPSHMQSGDAVAELRARILNSGEGIPLTAGGALRRARRQVGHTAQFVASRAEMDLHIYYLTEMCQMSPGREVWNRLLQIVEVDGE